MRTRQTLRVVAVFEASKGFLALVAASGFFLLVHKDLDAHVRLVEHAHLNPEAHYPNIFIDAATHLQHSNVLLIAQCISEPLGLSLYVIVHVRPQCYLINCW